MREVTDNVIIENARIIFRNFAGKEKQFNREGDRNFCVCLDHEKAEKLRDLGWNVKALQPRDEGDEPTEYLPVKVSYKNIPPKIIMVTDRNKVRLSEETVETLDYADIRNVDLTIRPYNWSVNGKSGVSGYVKTMYATIDEDGYEAKYADMESPEDDDLETLLPFA